MIWHSRRNISPSQKRCGRSFLRWHGPTLGVLCWFWCPHSKNTQTQNQMENLQTLESGVQSESWIVTSEARFSWLGSFLSAIALRRLAQDWLVGVDFASLGPVPSFWLSLLTVHFPKVGSRTYTLIKKHYWLKELNKYCWAKTCLPGVILGESSSFPGISVL